MKRIVLVVLLAVTPMAWAATADTSAQVTRDGRWLKAEIQKFEKVQAAVADSTAPATNVDANEAMFLAGYVVGIINIEKFHTQMAAGFLVGAVEAGRTKKVSHDEAKGVEYGIDIAAPLTNTEFASEHFHVDQYVQAIKNYLEKHPDKWDLGAEQIVE
jgi:hypothetical protein